MTRIERIFLALTSAGAIATVVVHVATGWLLPAAAPCRPAPSAIEEISWRSAYEACASTPPILQRTIDACRETVAILERRGGAESTTTSSYTIPVVTGRGLTTAEFSKQPRHRYDDASKALVGGWVTSASIFDIGSRSLTTTIKNGGEEIARYDPKTKDLWVAHGREREALLVCIQIVTGELRREEAIGRATELMIRGQNDTQEIIQRGTK